MRGLEELVDMERRLSVMKDGWSSLRLIVESAVQFTGAAGGALWAGDPSLPDSLATVVCAVGSTSLGRNRFIVEDRTEMRERWTTAERRKRLSSTPAIVAGETAGVLTIFH